MCKNLVEKTISRIKEWHKGQMYGNNHYYTHCIDVANYGKYFFKEEWTEDCFIAALLHDTIEDTNVTANTLKELGYNQNIINIVLLLTKDNNANYQENINKIIDSKNREAMMVKYCDNHVNFTGDKNDWTQKKKIKSQIKYAKSMASLLEALY